jgi:hypothetical protein
MITTPTITLDNDPADTTKRFRRELARLEKSRTEIETEAVTTGGRDGAEQLAQFESDLSLARASLAAAERVEKAAAAKIASPEAIAAALDEFEADETLGVSDIEAAVVAIGENAQRFLDLVAAHNRAIAIQGRKLRALGIPNSGMTVDGEPVTITDYRISIRGGEVGIIDSEVNYINGVLQPIITGRPVTAPQKVDGLAGYDSRTTTREHLSVELTREYGGRAVGTTLSTRTGHAPGALKQLVLSGHAIVVEGQVEDDPNCGDDDDDSGGHAGVSADASSAPERQPDVTHPGRQG